MSDATRKLATIVAVDVAGYSARTEADEVRVGVHLATSWCSRTAICSATASTSRRD